MYIVHVYRYNILVLTLLYHRLHEIPGLSLEYVIRLT